MANAAVKPAPREWALENPWWWMGLGLASCAAAWLWVTLLADRLSAIRFGLVVLGLLAMGISLNLRLRFSQPSFLGKLVLQQRNLILEILAGLFGMMTLALTLLLGWGIIVPESCPWRWGPLLLWWLVVAPMSAACCLHCVRRLGRQEPLSAYEEAAALLLLAALACFCAARALIDPDAPLHLESMRLFLGVMTLVALVASGLVLIPQRFRRAVVSLLILLHFGGICTTALAVPPTPTVIAQLWYRIYRPYLEFVYLTNAYHFYAPDPGAPSYLWFRIMFEDQQGKLYGQWLKVPDMDDNGWHRHGSGLTYQRYMALTETTIPTDSASFFVQYSNGGWGPAPFYQERLLHTPKSASEPIIIGRPRPRGDLVIPFHADIPETQQYAPPSRGVKSILESYARHVTHHARFKDYRAKSVKIYRVVHVIPPSRAYISGVLNPNDPDMYRAYFMGEYNPEGILIDPREPFLYWVLPTIRENPMSAAPRFKSYAHKHAGDPFWIRNEYKRWEE